MCGIAGYLHFDRNRLASTEVLKRMTNIIAHRGPDAEGFHLNNNVALGHRRLSIIDLSTGNQPMYSDDECIVLVFNGEIYNYLELRDELGRCGHKFKTSSDTEVIIRAYEEWGPDCQHRFNGMWAFAVWDTNKNELFLSRDRIGKKPLHFAMMDNTFIFGSEIKCITAYGVPKLINHEVMEIYLTLGYVPAPYTFYKDIYKLMPGHYIIVKDENINPKKYWDLPEIDEHEMHLNKNDVYENFEYLLKDSIKIRMQSDVPFGAFLSGGLDSTSIVALMSEVSNLPIETFTIGFKEEPFDERPLARDLAYKFGCNHHEKLVEPELFDDAKKKILFHYDEPFGDSSAIPIGYVSKHASESVKMVLTGDGGDELLSGYPRYQTEKLATQLQMVPNSMKKILPFLLKSFAYPLRGNLRYKANWVLNMLETLALNYNGRLIAKDTWINPKLMPSLLADNKHRIKIEDYINNFMQGCTYNDNFYKNMYYNLKLSLPNCMLVKVDRMSMAYSLETRCPFLDYRLIEFMVGVDKSIKMSGYERKSVLRRTIGKKLSGNILKAPKKGFVVPLREWFKKESFGEQLNMLAKIDFGVNLNLIKEVIKKNDEGVEDYGNFIWMLFLLKDWMLNQ